MRSPVKFSPTNAPMILEAFLVSPHAGVSSVHWPRRNLSLFLARREGCSCAEDASGKPFSARSLFFPCSPWGSISMSIERNGPWKDFGVCLCVGSRPGRRNPASPASFFTLRWPVPPSISSPWACRRGFPPAPVLSLQCSAIPLVWCAGSVDRIAVVVSTPTVLQAVFATASSESAGPVCASVHKVASTGSRGSACM